MRYVWVFLLLAAAIGPFAVLSAPASFVLPRAVGAGAPRTVGQLDSLLLVVVTSRARSGWQGLALSSDGGKTWPAAGGLPRGSFYNLAADPTHRGTAYMSNGDVYASTDGGARWALLPGLPPPSVAGPGGLTVVAVDPRDGTLYAAGATVVARRRGSGAWQTWGRDWPAGAVPTMLLAGMNHDLYAVAGDGLYYGISADASWRRVNLPGAGGTIAALTPAIDGRSIEVSARGGSDAAGYRLWTVARTTATALATDGLPTGAAINLLWADKYGADLYAGTSRGLFRLHQPTAIPGAGTAAAGSGTSWEQVSGVPADDPIVAIVPAMNAQTFVAASRDGALYQGQSAPQRLQWGAMGNAHHTPAGTVPPVALLGGREWSPISVPTLPSEFAGSCQQFGRAQAIASDVCGPFRGFYLLDGGHFVFGYPFGAAHAADHGMVVQRFEKASMKWSRRGDVALVPLDRATLRALGFRRTPKETIAQALRAGTPYLKGYYVDPVIFAFWLQYQLFSTSIFGPPISRAYDGVSSDGSGRAVTVQFFTNARLEYDRRTGATTPSYLPHGQ